MSRRLSIGIGLLIGLLAISIPIVLAVYLAWRQSSDSQRAIVASIADDVLRRSEESTDQTLSVVQTLKQQGTADPCSSENIRLMGKLDLGSDKVQAVGYVRDNHLLCSSYGVHDTPVGPPLYTTPYGIQTRSNVEFPVYPGLKFLLVTDVQSGYTTAIHPNRPLDVFTRDPQVSVGVFSTVSRKPVIVRGVVKQEWLDRLGAASAMQYVDGEYLVAISKSQKYGLAAFAVIPSARVAAGLRSSALTLVPIGALAGVLLACVVAYLVREHLAMRSLIKVALRHNEFFLEYQPLMDLRSGRCVGAEALIRWRRPDGKIVRPDLFIPVAEEAGLIRSITRRVLELVAHDAAELLRQRSDLHVAINLSAQDLQSQETVQLVLDFMKRMRVKASSVLVEVTERGFMQADLAHRIMCDLHANNIRIAIDDFGTGYSSLSYLQTFQLDYLKIDKSFVDTMGGEAATSLVAHHIIEMAKSLNLEMIAEGVETQAQLRYLQERGVQFAQGWHFSKALPFGEFVQFLARPEVAAPAGGAPASLVPPRTPPDISG